MRIATLCAALIAVSSSSGSPQSLFEFDPIQTAPARIDVWPQTRSGQPVPRYLYGKFTEHLWWNVYNGLWAQILKNTGFESWELLGEGSGRVRDWVERHGFPDSFPDLRITREPLRDVAPWWAPYGQAEVNYQLDKQSFNSGHSQRLSARSVQGGAGIQQPIFLPLHRIKRYDLSFYAKGSSSVLATVRSPKQELARATVSIGSRQWQRHSVGLTVESGAVSPGTPLLFRIELARPGDLWLDQIFLFPADHREGFDPDVVEMLRTSRLPLLRFPGGNFVSGYHWEDGIGDVHQRPTRRNLAWGGFEPNHVGMDEYMALCKLIGSEPLICINAGNGTAQEAANWVEYANGSTATRYGALRARNGHPKPYNVKLWEIGNELYGKWQIGHCTPEEYASRYAEFQKAMRAVDPAIRFLAIGQNQEWIRPLLQKHPEIVLTLAVHELPGGGIPADAPPREVFEELMAYPAALREKLQGLAGQMKEAGVKPRFAITEAQIFTNKRPLPTNDSLAEALFLAGIIHMSIREGDLVEMITHSALVNHGGGLRKQREIVYATPVHYASVLYGTSPGAYPVRIRVAAPEYRSPGRFLDRGQQVPLLDAISLVSDDGRELTLLVMNRSAEAALTSRITLHDFPVAPTVRVTELTGASFMARNSLDAPEHVRLQERALSLDSDTMEYRFPPHSLARLVFRLREVAGPPR